MVNLEFLDLNSTLFPLLHISNYQDFFIALNTGSCRNNDNLGNYDCLPILFPDWEDYAIENLGLTDPQDLADAVSWVTFLIYAMGRSMALGAFVYPTLLSGLIIQRIARA